MCKSCPVIDRDWQIGTRRSRRLEEGLRPWVTPSCSGSRTTTDADRAKVGGKNASLGTMIAAGLPVPPGFAVTTDAYTPCASTRTCAPR
jgi:hypothetical protein